MAKEQAQSGKGGKAKLITLLVVLMLLLAGGAVAATLFLTGAFKPQAQALTDPAAPTPAPPPPPAHYVSLDPPLILNFAYQGEIRFAQVSVAAMARSEATVRAVEAHLPRIRNALIMLFSSKSFDALEAVVGKEAVRQEALLAIREILQEETRVPPVEALYFTNFVMQ